MDCNFLKIKRKAEGKLELYLNYMHYFANSNKGELVSVVSYALSVVAIRQLRIGCFNLWLCARNSVEKEFHTIYTCEGNLRSI